MKPNEPDMTPDELAALIDSLVASGTQHINLKVGAETKVQTVNSTECSPRGACAVPNFDLNDEDDDEVTQSEEESDDDDL